MQDAFHYRKKYSKDGRRPEEVEWAIGGILVVVVVVLVLCLTGHASLSVPASLGGLWQLWRK